MWRRTLVKVGIVLLLLLIFIGYNVYVKWDKSHFTVDTDAFNVKDSFTEVMEDEYKSFEGLKLADQFNKIKDIDITEEFPNQQRKLKIHKAWLLPGHFFVLYSVNLQKDDQSPEDIPELDFSKVIMQFADEELKAFDIIQNDDFRLDNNEEYEGTVYDQRLYRSLVLGVDFDSLDDEEFDYPGQSLTDSKVTLDEATLTDHGTEDNGNDTKNHIENLTLTDSFTDSDYKLATIPINEEISLDNGHSIEFRELELNIFENLLEIHGDRRDATIQNLGSSITWEGKEPDDNVIYSGGVTEDAGHYYISFAGFRDVPSHLDIDLNNISYTKDENVQFDIPPDFDFSGESQKLGEVEDISFYFEGYEEPDDVPQDVIALKVGWDSASRKSIPSDTYNNMLMNYDLQKQLEGWGTEEGRETTRNSATNILSIQNEKEEEPEYTDPISNPNHENAVRKGDSIMVYLDRPFVKNSEEIHLNIEHFTYQEELDNESFRLNIPDDFVSEED